MPHYISCLATDLLPAFDDLTHRTPCGKWQLAASVLATFLALLDGYRPSEDAVGEAPPAEDASMMAALLVPRYAADGGHAAAAGRAGGGGAGGGGAGGAGGALGGGLGGAGGMGGFGGGMSGAASTPANTVAAAAASAASWPAVPPRQRPRRDPSGVGGGAARGAPVGYTLPSLHPAFLLHCAFAMPRSQLLHSLHRLPPRRPRPSTRLGTSAQAAAAAAACRLRGGRGRPQRVLGRRGDGRRRRRAWPAPPKGGYGAGAAPASVERALVYHTASLAVRLLHLLAASEGGVRDKLRRLHDAHARLLGWGCWSAEQRAALRALHAERLRSLPPLRVGASALATSLAHPITYTPPPSAAAAAAPAGGGSALGAASAFDAAAVRHSPLGALLHILRALTATQPAAAAAPAALAGARLLRFATRALGDSLATLLRTEGLLPTARAALLALLQGAADPPAPRRPRRRRAWRRRPTRRRPRRRRRRRRAAPTPI